MLKYQGTTLTPARIVAGIRRRLTNCIEKPNAFRGVYASFAEAEAAAPKFKPTGYDLAQSDNWYLSKLDRVTEEDYPVLYWLRPALEHARTLYEMGGHVGVAYYGYKTVLPFPEDLHWTICDVPSVTSAGRTLAVKRGANDLRFVTHPDQTDGAEILLAAGSLQYIDSPSLVDTIGSFRIKPKHVLINNTPVRDGPSFVTLQNIVTAYCPYRIFSRTELIQSVIERGYELVDSWEKSRTVRIPRHPNKSADVYAGFYFRAT